eukprot:14269973-Heterocapsa_arctica.AAC.1
MPFDTSSPPNFRGAGPGKDSLMSGNKRLSIVSYNVQSLVAVGRLDGLINIYKDHAVLVFQGTRLKDSELA